MNIDFHGLFYHFLWLVWPRRQVSIWGRTVTYCLVPDWLLGGLGDPRRKTPLGMYVVYFPRRQLMIFISKHRSYEEMRCTLCHEYFEGVCFLEKNKNRIYKIFFEACELLRPEIPDLISRMDKVVAAHQDPEEIRQHSFYLMALAIELALAKKEMKPEKFSEYLTGAIQYRL